MEQRRRAGFKVAFVVVCICLFDRRRCICKYAFLCICNQRSQGGWLVLRWRPLKQCLILFVVLLITGIACTYILAIFSLYCFFLGGGGSRKGTRGTASTCSRQRAQQTRWRWRFSENIIGTNIFRNVFLHQNFLKKKFGFNIYWIYIWQQNFLKIYLASTFSENIFGINIFWKYI